MKVSELLNIAESNGDGDTLLVVVRDKLPTGGIRLFGKRGPTASLIANVQSREDGRYDVVAYFPSKKIVKYIKDNTK